CREPFHALQTIAARAVFFPIGRVSPAESVHRLLRPGELDGVRANLDDQDNDIDVVEKAQVDMGHLECRRRKGGSRIGHPHVRYILAAKDADRRIAGVGRAAATCVAVKKTSDVREKGYELAVMSLLEFARSAAEFVTHFAPWICGTFPFHQIPVLLNLRSRADRRELQRPEQDLPKMTNELAIALLLHGWGRRQWVGGAGTPPAT